MKYRVPEQASPEEAARVLWREKQREDRLRRRTRHAVARWLYADALVPERLAALLAQYGVRPLRRNTWFGERSP